MIQGLVNRLRIVQELLAQNKRSHIKIFCVTDILPQAVAKIKES
jgi:hypothetical protein